MPMLESMLTYRRAHDSPGEAAFIQRFIAPVAQPLTAPCGTVHAYAVRVGVGSRIAFCAHTDSVHNRQNPAVHQRVAFDSVRGEYFVADPKQRDCLGADNAAGCYVLLRMIEHRVPGLYLFFRGEERGGIGSGWLCENRPELFVGIDAAIGFDRRGTNSIITEMMVGRTCSDAFADSLADELRLRHSPDPTGSFTDTANLAALVPECTNVSVGYENEHSADETLDAAYVERLVAACVDAFTVTPALHIEREPGDFHDYRPSYCSLAGMTDKEIEELVLCSTYDELVRLLKDARDEMW
jgi:hypothetical protein